MILNELDVLDRMTREKLEERIVITPLISPETQFGPSSVDLRLGSDFKLIKNVKNTHLNPFKDEEQLIHDVIAYTEDIRLDVMDAFVLHPHEFALATTLEYIQIPYDLAARLEGRSSWGRLGLQVHSTAGFVDPGFAGALTFELQNVGKIPIPLFAGLRVAQISFYDSLESLIPYTKKPLTKYAYKPTVMGSLFYKDPEFRYIKKIKQNQIQISVADIKEMEDNGIEEFLSFYRQAIISSI